MTDVDDAIGQVWGTRTKILIAVWAFSMLIIVAGLGFLVNATLDQQDENERIAKNACRDVNTLQTAMQVALIVVRDGVDLPVARTTEEQQAIVDNYNQALLLLSKADCKE